MRNVSRVCNQSSISNMSEEPLYEITIRLSPSLRSSSRAHGHEQREHTDPSHRSLSLSHSLRINKCTSNTYMQDSIHLPFCRLERHMSPKLLNKRVTHKSNFPEIAHVHLSAPHTAPHTTHLIRDLASQASHPLGCLQAHPHPAFYHEVHCRHDREGR